MLIFFPPQKHFPSGLGCSQKQSDELAGVQNTGNADVIPSDAFDSETIRCFKKSS